MEYFIKKINPSNQNQSFQEIPWLRSKYQDMKKSTVVYGELALKEVLQLPG